MVRDELELTEEELKSLEQMSDPDKYQERVTLSDQRIVEGFECQDLEKQIVKIIVSDAPWVESLMDVVLPVYFTNSAHQRIVSKVYQYMRKYGELPSMPILQREVLVDLKDADDRVKTQIIGELKSCLLSHAPSKAATQYLTDMVTEFVQKQGIKLLFHSTLEDMQNDKFSIDRLSDGVLRISQTTLGARAFEGLDAIQYFDWADSLNQDWIIKDWLGAGTLTLFTGREKLGKSTLLFSMIPALMTGKAWLNKMPVRQCPVLYLDFENPPAYVRDNLIQYLPREQYAPVRALLDVPKKLPPALTANWLKGYMKHRGLQKHPSGVIFIDSARAAFGSLFEEVANWENSASEVRKALKPIAEVARETGWAIVAVHHQNKTGGTSGSTDWGGAVDAVWSYAGTHTRRELSIIGRLLNQPDDLVFDKVGAVLTMQTRKEAFVQEFAKVEAEDGAKVLEFIPVMNGHEVTEANGMTTEKLRAATGWSLDKVKRVLGRLHEATEIQRTKIGKPPPCARVCCQHCPVRSGRLRCRRETRPRWSAHPMQQGAGRSRRLRSRC